MSDLIHWILQFFKMLFPPIITEAATMAKDSVIKKRTLLEQLKKAYRDNGWPWSEINIIFLRDCDAPKKHQIFNDVAVIAGSDELFCCWVTTEPGKHWDEAARIKWLGSADGWPGRYNLGFYKDHFYVSTYHDVPALRQRRRVMVTDMDTGKQRMAGDMHFHARSGTGEYVYFSSAGCPCHKTSDNAYVVDDLIKGSKLYHTSKRHNFDFALVDKKNFNLMQERIE